MKIMTRVLGIILVVLALILGFYTGWCFINDDATVKILIPFSLIFCIGTLSLGVLLTIVRVDPRKEVEEDH